MRKLLYLALFCHFLFGVVETQAQPSTALNLMPLTWQSNRTNPAFLMDHSLVLGLPSFAGSFFSTEATLNDFLNDDYTQITLDDAIEVMKENNILRTNFSLETFSVGWQKGDLQWSLHHALKADAFLDYPKTLPQIIWQGNEPFIGQTVDISHDLQAFSYHEIGLGLGKKINPYLSVGAKVKWLNGLNDVSTPRNDLSLYTDNEIYELTLTSDYQINTSSLIEYNGLGDLSNVFDVNELLQGQLFTKNQGVALDLGTKITLSNLTIAASVLDLGFINWKEKVNNYSVKGTFNYTGLDIARDYFNDSLDFSSAVDSLKTILVVGETQETYRTNLPAEFYVTAMYELPTWQFGASFFGEMQREDFFPALTVQIQKHLGRSFWLGANYTAYQGSAIHLGLTVLMQKKYIQAFVTTNDVVGVLSARNSNWVNAQAGINLLLPHKDKN